MNYNYLADTTNVAVSDFLKKIILQLGDISTGYMKTNVIKCYTLQNSLKQTPTTFLSVTYIRKYGCFRRKILTFLLQQTRKMLNSITRKPLN